MRDRTDPLEVVGALHSGVADPDDWTRGLDGLSGLLDGAALLHISLVAGQSGYRAEGHKFPNEALELTIGPLAVPDPMINPWFAAVPRLKRQKLTTVDDVSDRASFEQSATWRDAMVPFDLGCAMGTLLERLPERIDFSMVFRSNRRNDFSATERAAYMQIVPHLARALRVRYELDAARTLAADALGALDTLARGVVLTAPDGTVRFANRAAESILAECDGIQSRRGAITAPRSSDSNALSRLVWNAAQTGIGEGMAAVAAVSISRPSGRTPYAVVAEPLAPAHNERHYNNAAHGSILFIADASRVGRAPPARLALLYGLTATEAEVASRLAQADRLAAIAADMGVSQNTVKTHQKAVFEKIGVTRQAELVRRIAADIGDFSA